MITFGSILKKTSALIVGNENDFVLGQKILEHRKHTSIIINLSTATFKIMGSLSGKSVDSLILICQETLLSLSFFSPKVFPHENDLPPHQPTNNKQKRLVEKTCAYLMNNLEKPLSISKICKEMHSNRNSISLAFKQELNIGVSGWLRNQRMVKAKQLLHKTELSIHEISSLVGYSDQANFATAFKNKFHKSPVQIRRILTI